MTPSPLSPKARALLQRAREDMLPEAGERDRIEALLNARLAPLAPIPDASGWRFSAANAWRAALGVAVVGGAGFLVLKPAAPNAAPAPSITVASVSKPVAAQPVASTEVDDAPPIVEPDRAPAPESASAAPVTQDYLAQEVALLSRATSALRAGRADEALKLLDEHQRKFRSGLLSVDRRTARAQALCALMRISEGRAELARLPPQSPAAARATRACDVAAAKSAPR
ncbi:MAG TPA: hypothetical protein VEQ58_04700 [Polyangiaceae bacterium]|nr:hypothetical protein [Polyangiaceae bacterium]